MIMVTHQIHLILVNSLVVVSTNNTVSKEMYRICNGPDDGRRMILCENEHCSSGT